MQDQTPQRQLAQAPNAGRIAVAQVELAAMQVRLQALVEGRQRLSDKLDEARGTAAEPESHQARVIAHHAKLRQAIRLSALESEITEQENKIARQENEIRCMESEVYHSGPAQLARVQAGQRAVLSATEVAGMDDMLAYSARAA